MQGCSPANYSHIGRVLAYRTGARLMDWCSDSGRVLAFWTGACIVDGCSLYRFKETSNLIAEALTSRPAPMIAADPAPKFFLEKLNSSTASVPLS